MGTKTLKLQKPMMHGPAVVRLQELFELLGYGDAAVDGVFGPDTQEAVLDFQADSGLRPDGIVGPKTWNILLRDPCIFDTRTVRKAGPLIDRRDFHSYPRLYNRQRSWNEIHGVTLHQTGCEMPRDPAGWDRLNAHIGISQEGLAILVNDPTDFIWHAQGLSRSTIGIEIEGNYYGIDGNERTLWRGGGGPHHLNDKMIEALRDVRQWLVEQFVEQDQPWTRVHAHRQSSQSRIADPGEEIWKTIAIPWISMIPGATAGPDFWCTGTGRPIPVEWDDRYQEGYFCSPRKQ